MAKNVNLRDANRFVWLFTSVSEGQSKKDYRHWPQPKVWSLNN